MISQLANIFVIFRICACGGSAQHTEEGSYSTPTKTEQEETEAAAVQSEHGAADELETFFGVAAGEVIPSQAASLARETQSQEICRHVV